MDATHTTETNMNETTAAPRKEWVAVLHGQNGTIKIAYRNPAALARGLAEQTKGGWVAAHVYERDAQTYADDAGCSSSPCRVVTRQVNDDNCRAHRR